MSKRDGIRKRGNSWEVCIPLGYDEQAKRYRRSYVTVRGTRADAERRRRELLTAKENGTSVDPSRLTVSAYLTGWVQQCEARGLAPRTVEGYESIVKLYLTPRIGSVPLQKLAPAQIEKLYADLLATGLSDRTVLHAHRALHCALRRAVRLRLIPANPADAVDAPKPKRTEMHVLDVAGMNRLLRLLREGDDSLLHMAALVAVTTGLRRGELLALRWADVDLDAATVTVQRSLQKTKAAGLSFKEPKTARSRRTVTLPQRTVRELKAHRARQAQQRLLVGLGYNDLDLVFAQADGRPVDPDAISSAFSKFRDDNDFEVRFHDLRHTHATLMLNARQPLRLVADRLGHSTAVLTIDTYAHTLPGQDAEAAEQFDSFLDETADTA